MKLLDPRPTFAYLGTALRDKYPKLAYLHVVKSRVTGDSDIDGNADEENEFLRDISNSGEGGEDCEGVHISWWIYPRYGIAHHGGQERAYRLWASAYLERECVSFRYGGLLNGRLDF